MNNDFKQTGIENSSFGDNANIEIHNEINSPQNKTDQSHSGSGDNVAGDKNTFNINLPKVSSNIPSDREQGTPYFVGRIEDLTHLHQALQQQKTSNIVSLCAVRGMGGIGKTELAIQYSLSPEYHQSYVACYWFSLRGGSLATLVLDKTFPYLAMPEELVKRGTIDQQVEWCYQNRIRW